ncbi:MAG: hypothetical protein AUJ75_02900 [Candidatus Omnitrophica bacterium CG1_02_49_10]|nr:MAG: hypothetical protein AUJ75_02900 [Candidatus Omnitrophica bacterium CG1_02_49_10]
MKSSSKGGFTLIELLLVAAILLALVSVSMPRFISSFKGLETDNLALNLVQLMRYAHTRAVADGVEYKVRIDKGISKYWLEKRDRSGGDNGFKAFKSKNTFPRRIPSGALVEIEGDGVAFYPDGSSQGAQFVISYGKAERYELYVAEATSDVRMDKK